METNQWGREPESPWLNVKAQTPMGDKQGPKAGIGGRVKAQGLLMGYTPGSLEATGMCLVVQDVEKPTWRLPSLSSGLGAVPVAM